MKKGIVTIALIAAMTLLTTPAQAAWNDTPAVYSSAELTSNAWEALDVGNNGNNAGYDNAIQWGQICAYYYGEKALLQNDANRVGANHTANHYLTQFQIATAPLPPASQTETTETVTDLYFDCWAYCDVATCYFVIGEAARKKAVPDNASAQDAYEMVKDAAGTLGPFADGLCAKSPESSHGAAGSRNLNKLVSGEYFANVWEVAPAASDGHYLVTSPVGTYYPAGTIWTDPLP